MSQIVDGGIGGRSPTRRKTEFLASFYELADISGDGAAIRKAIYDAMTGATLSARVPDPSGERAHVYAMIPDHAIRLTAARLLAEIWGLVGGRESLNITASDNSVHITVDQRVAELEAVGIPREQLVAELRQVIDAAERAEPTKPDPKPVL